MPWGMEKLPAQPYPPDLASLLDHGPVALFLDFDGTLVEIASGPDAIDVPADLARRLDQLRGRMNGRLALVSGRSLDNLADFLGPTELHRAGSHGAHILAPDGTVLRGAKPLPQAVLDAIAGFTDEHGLLYEKKPHGAAIHFRNRPDLEGEAHAFATALAHDNTLATKTGKCVIELVQPGADKGGAVKLLMQTHTFAGAIPIFIGDDVTDEDGFRACDELGGFGILVGNRDVSSARYRLPHVKDVYEWLNL